jgi:hypothetical protein
MENLEIKSGEGLGDIKFGMTEDQLIKLIGEPDEIEEYADEDNEDDETETWHYDEFEISVSFDRSVEWRLVNIAVSSPDSTFMGEHLIGLNREELIDKLKDLGLTQLGFEDYSEEGSDSKMIFAHEVGINFWLEDGELTEIQWGPLFIDDDTIKWPELN